MYAFHGLVRFQGDLKSEEDLEKVFAAKRLEFDRSNSPRKPYRRIISACQRDMHPASFAAMFRYEAVVHFAGLKAVAESVAHPEMYYENNMGGTMNLYAIMKKYGCKKVL